MQLANDIPTHAWWRKVRVAFVPGPMSSILETVMDGILRRFREDGHEVLSTPDSETELILTTAPFGEPLGWRQALFFSARRRFKMLKTPTIVTFLHSGRKRLQDLLDYFHSALDKDPPDPADFQFRGLSSRASQVLIEQGERGGPILALERVLQAQAKSIRIVLVVGDEAAEGAYHFDLVGAHPLTPAGKDRRAFYGDIVRRMVTAMSTHEITDHQEVSDPIPNKLWASAQGPAAMRRAGQEFGKRDFFTDMIRISDLVNVPAVSDAIAEQYSEGCFATWDPRLEGLISTVTGSARPVDKGSIQDQDLAVIVGVRDDRAGAKVRHVEGKRDDPPSSEAVEMIDMDERLPWIQLDPEWGIQSDVPVARSKLHGHRGVSAFDPSRVEHVTLDPAYYHYPVSCSTEAQARAIKAAFSRSEALQNPDDPRRVVFAVLPGHGIVIVEKWASGKEPFQLIWESMDSGALQISNQVPQGPLEYMPSGGHMMVLQAA
jgi:hypothetical protein